MAQHQTALETTNKDENIFVKAEHFFEDFAKNTQAIAQRAFERFEKRGFEFGNELEDWFKAERELLKKVPIEIKETDNSLDIRAEVPGFTAKDLKVSVEPTRITIKGETEGTTEKKDGEMIYTECRSNKIFRSFDLPRRVDADHATASIKDGVLNLVIPKIAETKPNDVKIETV